MTRHRINICEPNDKRQRKGGSGTGPPMEDETGRKRSLKHRQTEPPSQADRGSAGEKRSLCSHPPQPIPPRKTNRKQQRVTCSNQSEPVFWREGEGRVLLRRVHHRVTQSFCFFLITGTLEKIFSLCYSVVRNQIRNPLKTKLP